MALLDITDNIFFIDSIVHV